MEEITACLVPVTIIGIFLIYSLTHKEGKS